MIHHNMNISKVSNIAFAILPFLAEQILKLNGHYEYFGIYYS